MDGENKIVELKLEDILPNRFQPRISFNDDDLTELASSIREHGVLQPITVRPLGNKYEIIMGERRYKASKLAGKTTIPAIIKNLNDNDSAEVALVENIQRQDLTAIEEAICYKRILDAGYLTQESLAIKLGKTQSTIANKLRLLSLDEEVQRALLDKSITERHARSLLKLDNKEAQKNMLTRIIAERLTVRKTDEEIDKMNKSGKTNIPNNVIEDTEIETLDFDEKGENMTTFSQPSQTTMSVTQDVGSNFNIPTSPIMEEEPQETSQVQHSFFDNNIDNPGFMNVDNIIANAQDINVVKPVKDLNNVFLPPRSDDAEGDSKDLLRPGKFLNILNDEEENKVAKNVPTEENFDFNSYFAPVFTDEPVSAVHEEPVTTPVVPIVETDASNIFTPIEDNFSVPELDQKTEEKPIVEEPIDIYKGPTEEQLSTIQEKKQSTVISNDMRLVINTIRECANRLEDAGYIVDLEEIDFEDSYQAIFKINKM